MGNFEQVREVVMGDGGLMEELTRAATEAELFEKVAALARAHGFELAPGELQAVVRANRRAWLERWLPV